MYKKNKSIFFVILAHFLFSIQDMIIKLISDDYALHQIILIRSLVAFFFIAFFLTKFDGGIKCLYTKNIGLHLLRGLGITIANIFIYSAFVTISIGETMALFFVAPLMITSMSYFIFKQKINVINWIAVFLGMVGVLFIIKPGFHNFRYEYSFPIFAAISYTFVQLITFKIGKTEKASALAFYIQFVLIIMSIIIGLLIGDGRFGNLEKPTQDFLFRSWKILEFSDSLIIIGSGILSGLGMFFIAHAYRNELSSLVAPFEYVAVFFGVFWSILIFQNWPDYITWFGIFIIILAGVMNLKKN